MTPETVDPLIQVNYIVNLVVEILKSGLLRQVVPRVSSTVHYGKMFKTMNELLLNEFANVFRWAPTRKVILIVLPNACPFWIKKSPF